MPKIQLILSNCQSFSSHSSEYISVQKVRERERERERERGGEREKERERKRERERIGKETQGLF